MCNLKFSQGVKYITDILCALYIIGISGDGTQLAKEGGSILASCFAFRHIMLFGGIAVFSVDFV